MKTTMTYELGHWICGNCNYRNNGYPITCKSCKAENITDAKGITI